METLPQDILNLFIKLLKKSDLRNFASTSHKFRDLYAKFIKPDEYFYTSSELVNLQNDIKTKLILERKVVVSIVNGREYYSSKIGKTYNIIELISLKKMSVDVKCGNMLLAVEISGSGIFIGINGNFQNIVLLGINMLTTPKSINHTDKCIKILEIISRHTKCIPEPYPKGFMSLRNDSSYTEGISDMLSKIIDYLN